VKKLTLLLTLRALALVLPASGSFLDMAMLLL
jgi:hypothetical protein